MNDRATVNLIACGKCGHSNPSTSEFCRECGTNLYTSCPRCSHKVQVTEKFCGSCGTNLEALREADRKKIEEKFERIETLRDEFLFTDALLIAKGMTRLEADKFPGAAERARTLVAELEQARDLATERVARANRVARQLLEQHDYFGAAKILGELPKPLRGPEESDLLEDAVSKAQRIRTLRERVQEQLKVQPLAAFPMLAELVVLQPEDEKIRALGDQIAERVLKTAIAKADSGSFIEASRGLAQIPEAFSNSKVAAQRQQIDEVVWLERNLKECPLIDEALVSCAQRLSDRLGGKQPKAAQWLAEASKRWQEAKAKADTTLPWSASMTPRFGKELRFFNPLSRFQAESVKVPGGVTQLQRFSIALGLALQAIGRAPIEETLATKTAKGLARFNLLGKKKVTAAWGLDIGATSVKAAKVSLAGDKVTIEQLKIVELSTDAILSVDDADYREALRGAIAKLKDEIDLKGEPIIASVDSQGSMFRFVSLPAIDEAKFKEMVEHEAKALIPYALDQVYWYWHRFGTNNAGSREVVIVASRRKEVDDVVTLLSQHGLTVSGMQAGPVALLNLSLSTDPESPEPPRLILELGANHTHIVATWSNQAFIRTIGRGGRKLTQQLARDLKVTAVDAERTKLAPMAYESPLSLYRSLSVPLGELYLEIERSVRGAEQKGLPAGQALLLLSGGSGRLHGLPRVLCQGAEGIAMSDG